MTQVGPDSITFNSFTPDQYLGAFETCWSAKPDREKILAVLGALIDKDGTGRPPDVAERCCLSSFQSATSALEVFGKEISEVLNYTRKVHHLEIIVSWTNDEKGSIWHLRESFRDALRLFSPTTLLFDKFLNSNLNFDFQVRQLENVSKEELLSRIKLEESGETPNSSYQTVATKRHERSRLIAAYAKVQSNWACELTDCKQPIFFTINKRPFLEVHHIEPLACGGLDKRANVACLCPSHHREAHHGQNKTAIKVELTELRSRA